MNSQTRFLLNESDLPKAWYNINADFPVPPTPVLNPQTFEPVTLDFLNVLFPMELILQEISTERPSIFLRKYVKFTSCGASPLSSAPNGWKKP